MQKSLQNVLKIEHQELNNHIKTFFDKKIPCLIWGGTGVGKSEVVEETAREIAEEKYPDREFVKMNDIKDKDEILENKEDYFVFKDARISSLGSGGVRGIPDVSGDETEWKLPKWVKHFTLEGAVGIIFLDEFNHASPSVQSDFFQLILDNEIGDYALNDDVFVLGAGNREGIDDAKVFDISAPLRNRFAHLELKSPRGGKDGNWTDWASENEIDERIIGYMMQHEEKLNEFHTYKDYKTIPTPRTWEFASDLIKGNYQREKIKSLVSSVVGVASANSFIEYVKRKKELDAMKYIDSPSLATELDKKSPDVQMLFVSSFAEKFKNEYASLDDIIKIVDNLQRTEIGALILKTCKRLDKQRYEDEVFNANITDDFIERYGKIINR